MASFFRGPCIIYWVVWFFCLSYALGIATYSHTYAIRTEPFQCCFILVMGLCTFNCVMCFFGCCWIKCDIRHVICAVLFILPLLAVNMTLSIYGLHSLRNNTIVPSPSQTLKAVQDNLEAEQKLPEWLINAQEHSKCCGVFSYLDYPFGFNKSVPISLPITCCHGAHHGDHRTECILNTTFSNPVFKLPELTEEQMMSCNHSVSEIQVDGYTFPPDPGNVHTCGCYVKVHGHAKAISNSMFIFFVLLMAATVGMVIVYVKSACRKRDTLGRALGSDHSLDVDVELPDSLSKTSINESINSGKNAKKRQNRRLPSHQVDSSGGDLARKGSAMPLRLPRGSIRPSLR